MGGWRQGQRQWLRYRCSGGCYRSSRRRRRCGRCWSWWSRRQDGSLFCWRLNKSWGGGVASYIFYIPRVGETSTFPRWTRSGGGCCRSDHVVRLAFSPTRHCSFKPRCNPLFACAYYGSIRPPSHHRVPIATRPSSDSKQPLAPSMRTSKRAREKWNESSEMQITSNLITLPRYVCFSSTIMLVSIITCLHKIPGNVPISV